MQFPERVEVEIVGEYRQPIPTESDGFVGELAGGAVVVLRALIAPSHQQRFLAINVDGQKKVARKKEELSEQGVIYSQKIRIMPGNQGVPFVAYPHNNFRVVEFLAEGQMRVWELALVSQHGQFFRAVQPTWSLQAYHAGKRVVIPNLAQWPQLDEFLSQLLRPQAETFPRLGMPEPATDPCEDSLPANTGIVLWYNLAQGIGALQTAEGPARVHWSQVISDDRFVYLEAKQRVQFDTLRPPAASWRGTSFQHEATGIRVL